MFSKSKLQHLVSEKNKSIFQLSKEIGVSYTTLGRIVTGNQKDMKLSTAFKLADALEVDINELRKESGEDEQGRQGRNDGVSVGRLSDDD